MSATKSKQPPAAEKERLRSQHMQAMALPLVLPWLFLHEVLSLSETCKANSCICATQTYYVHLKSTRWIRSSVVFSRLSLRYPNCRTLTVQRDSLIDGLEVLMLRDPISRFWEGLHNLEMRNFCAQSSPASSISVSGSPGLIPLTSLKRLVLDCPKNSVVEIIRSCSASSLRDLTVHAPLAVPPQAGLAGGELHAALSPLRALTRLTLSQLFHVDTLALPESVCATLVHLALTRCSRLSQVKPAVALPRLDTIDLSHTAITTESMACLLVLSAPSSLKACHCPSLTNLHVGSSISASTSVSAAADTSRTRPPLPMRLRHLDLRCCRRLVSVSISGSGGGTSSSSSSPGSAATRPSSSLLSSLCSLRLEGCDALESLVVHAAILRRLCLSMLATLRSISLLCPHLQSLKLSGCSGLVGQDWLPAIIAGCPRLTSSTGRVKFYGTPLYSSCLDRYNRPRDRESVVVDDSLDSKYGRDGGDTDYGQDGDDGDVDGGDGDAPSLVLAAELAGLRLDSPSGTGGAGPEAQRKQERRRRRAPLGHELKRSMSLGSHPTPP